MNAINIPAQVLAELNRQLNQELYSAHSYRALSYWCEEQNLKGFARFFARQEREEHGHADKFAAHLIARRGRPELSAIPGPKLNFKSLLEAAQHALALERANTQGINTTYEAALSGKDYPAQVFLQWFINEQIEEEDWSSEMVERVEAAACAGSLSDLDRHIERYLDEGLFAEEAKAS